MQITFLPFPFACMYWSHRGAHSFTTFGRFFFLSSILSSGWFECASYGWIYTIRASLRQWINFWKIEQLSQMWQSCWTTIEPCQMILGALKCNETATPANRFTNAHTQKTYPNSENEFSDLIQLITASHAYSHGLTKKIEKVRPVRRVSFENLRYSLRSGYSKCFRSVSSWILIMQIKLKQKCASTSTTEAHLCFCFLAARPFFHSVSLSEAMALISTLNDSNVTGSWKSTANEMYFLKAHGERTLFIKWS